MKIYQHTYIPFAFTVITLYKSLVKTEPIHVVERQNNNEPKDSFNNVDHLIETNDLDAKYLELQIAQSKINELEYKIQQLEDRIPRKYPDVTYLNYKNRKRILVTGGAGFVGSHLVDYLMMQGHEIIVADNFFTGRKRNVEHWFGHENFELIHHDIVNALFIEVDEIYHLASPASPPHYMYNPVKTIKTNTMGKNACVVDP